MKAQLEAEIASLEALLQSKKTLLESYVREIPSEFHTLTTEIFQKIESFFHHPAAPKTDTPPAPPAA